eukprot:7517774-Pyramimonas_sp.AAC.1
MHSLLRLCILNPDFSRGRHPEARPQVQLSAVQRAKHPLHRVESAREAGGLVAEGPHVPAPERAQQTSPLRSAFPSG